MEIIILLVVVPWFASLLRDVGNVEKPEGRHDPNSNGHFHMEDGQWEYRDVGIGFCKVCKARRVDNLNAYDVLGPFEG